MSKKTISKILSISFILLYGVILSVLPAYCDEISDLENQKATLEQQKEEKQNSLKAIESKLQEINNSSYSVSQKISMIDEEISTMQENITNKEQEIATKESELDAKTQEINDTQKLLDEVSSQLYKDSHFDISNFFLSLNSWNKLVQNLHLKKTVAEVLKDKITQISGEFTSLTEAKDNLHKEMEDLNQQKEDLDSSMALLEEEKKSLQGQLYSSYNQKQTLSAEITDINSKLSALQQAIIAARTAGTASVTSIGETQSTVIGTSIAQAPAGQFGVFSIGAYTHRNGMSQWGAKARADAGQTYDQILAAYYPGTTLSTVEMDTITVDGYGTMSFEDSYLLGIYEVPESWPIEVLKAQAIAARTYAIRYTNHGAGSICTTESCQVYKGDPKTGAWKQAVEATRGVVLQNSDGSLASTQYAAVHGGWGNSVGWDTVSGTGNDWMSDSYEKLSGISWFYKSWYTYGANGTESCGHSAWLTNEEMAVILDAYLAKNGSNLISSVDYSRLLPSDFGKCPMRADYGNTSKKPYTLADYKLILANPVTQINSVRTLLADGNTTSVVFSTNIGEISMSGVDFKNIYNQMAPGHMRIQQASYAYFNVEMK
ncbi:hypothetical protein J6Z48_00335 [bacterium]|nr:hypothetical protein [bacterium]